MAQDHPSQLWAAEVPVGSGRWHAVDARSMADALTDAGYTVRAYLPMVGLMEATGKRKHVRAAAKEGPRRISEGVAQSAVRGFLLSIERERIGA